MINDAMHACWYHQTKCCGSRMSVGLGRFGHRCVYVLEQQAKSYTEAGVRATGCVCGLMLTGSQCTIALHYNSGALLYIRMPVSVGYRTIQK